MERLSYLFSFNFESGCMNDYVRAWCKETKSDYFHSFGELYVDLFGSGIYNRIEIIDVAGKKEVYYDVLKTKRSSLSRIFELKEKCVQVNPYENRYKIRAFFEKGDFVDTFIYGNKKKILTHYLDKKFNIGTITDNVQKCVRVEFLKAT